MYAPIQGVHPNALQQTFYIFLEILHYIENIRARQDLLKNRRNIKWRYCPRHDGGRHGRERRVCELLEVACPERVGKIRHNTATTLYIVTLLIRYQGAPGYVGSLHEHIM